MKHSPSLGDIAAARLAETMPTHPELGRAVHVFPPYATYTTANFTPEGGHKLGTMQSRHRLAIYSTSPAEFRVANIVSHSFTSHDRTELSNIGTDVTKVDKTTHPTLLDATRSALQHNQQHTQTVREHLQERIVQLQQAQRIAV